ncbi:uncharacterized protein Z518_10089 [Rhinocladiella mackenziei CBS 650.93]|uniref:Pisatin demethylase n=1 Tax=Rhinocladiella mackenziei CBS 650.93 TaxID=1442369 RepID=A0A0D2GRY0_9EURO|nr:uncharacterized protein Z518_10089 [Rhinocladiella mackenziei CBS 650.93]KIX01023.1 hypothetical protein Z518_10089 [Rhinocladiella mackenziei CBS 650.93]
MGLFPGLHPWFMRLTKLLRLPSPTEGLDNFITDQITRHTSETSQTDGAERDTTFLSKILTLRNEGKATDAEVRLCVEMNIVAGSDTTAISLSSIMYTNTPVLKRLRQELDDQSKPGRSSDPVAYQEAQEIPYLQAVIKEALRLHGAVGTQLARVVPKGGAVIEGQYFPKGVEVGVNGWALHYKKETFVEDVLTFRPERWLDCEKTNISLPESLAFGQGARSWIGKNISILEMSKAIPQIVQNFDTDLSESTRQWFTKCRWFVKPKYNARIRHRASS